MSHITKSSDMVVALLWYRGDVSSTSSHKEVHMRSKLLWVANKFSGGPHMCVYALPNITSVPKYNNFLTFQSQIFSSLTVDGKKDININTKVILVYS